MLHTALVQTAARWIIGALLLGGCTKNAALPSAHNFVPDAFIGNWHEVARMPHPLEVHCAATTFEYIPKSKKRIRIHQYCFYKSMNGPMRQEYAEIIIPDEQTPWEFIIQFGGPLAGSYQVIYLSDTRQTAVVGERSRKYLWLLSRTLTPDATEIQNAVRAAANAGYDSSDMVFSKDLLHRVGEFLPEEALKNGRTQ